jgi:hypothetical protein
MQATSGIRSFMTEESKSRIMNALNTFPRSYPVISYFLFIILYAIYIFLGTTVESFHLEDIWTDLGALTKSLLIAYQLAFIKFLLNNSEAIFKDLDSMYENTLFSTQFNKRSLRGSYWYLIIIFLSIIIPFLKRDPLQFSAVDPGNTWAFGLDIYNFFLELISLTLFSIILWLVIDIVWSLTEVGKHSRKFPIKISVFALNVRLKPFKRFVLKCSLLYFIGISLAIISYYDPSIKMADLTYQLILYILLSSLGIVIFTVGLDAVQKIISCKIEHELFAINKEIIGLLEEQRDITSTGDYERRGNELTYLSTSIDVLQKQSERLSQINRRTVFNLETIAYVAISFLIPTITFLVKIRAGGAI